MCLLLSLSGWEAHPKHQGAHNNQTPSPPQESQQPRLDNHPYPPLTGVHCKRRAASQHLIPARLPYRQAPIAIRPAILPLQFAVVGATGLCCRYHQPPDIEFNSRRPLRPISTNRLIKDSIRSADNHNHLSDTFSCSLPHGLDVATKSCPVGNNINNAPT